MNATPPRPRLGLLLTLLEFLQSGIAVFAAGPIMGEIGAAPEEFSLATVAYACAAITIIAMHRWLVERPGWRNFVLISLAVFALGCVVCAAGDSYQSFLIGRVIMALGRGCPMHALFQSVNQDGEEAGGESPPSGSQSSLNCDRASRKAPHHFCCASMLFAA